MYETSTATAVNSLVTSNAAVFNQSTIAAILKLTTQDNTTVRFDQVTPDASGNVTVAAGAEVVLVTTSDTVQSLIKPPVNAPVVIFQGKGGVIAVFNDGPTTVASDGVADRIVVGSAGNDNIVINDTKDTKVILGTGNSTVTTGKGYDTVEAGLGNSTITGGTGDYAVVKLKGNASDYQVTVQNGHAVVTNKADSKTTDISKIQFVQLDGSKALIFSNNSVESAIATLYHTTFGRDADAGGLNYWFDLAKAGASLKQIAAAFTTSQEFAGQAAKSNADFVQDLYQNTFGRQGEAGGVSFWTNALAQGASRADLLQSFSNIAANNIDPKTTHTEAQVIGNVTLITGII